MRHFFIFIFFTLITNQLFAVTSFKTRFSGEYYRDAAQKSHSVFYLDWTFNNIHASGVQTFLDLSISNDTVQNEWNGTPYQFYVMIPYQFNDSLYKVRSTIGRVFFVEDFEIGLMDGAQVNLYSQKFSYFLFAGGMHISEESQINLDDKIYGGHALYHGEALLAKFGTYAKKSTTKEKWYSTATLSASSHHTFGTPSLTVRAQWDHEESKISQSRADVSFGFKNSSVAFGASKTRVDQHFLTKRNIIYQLFAVDEQKTFYSSLDVPFGHNFDAQLKISKVQYDSSSFSSKAEGEKQDLSCNVYLGHQITLSPYVTNLKSYGGTLISAGSRFKYDFHRTSSANIDFDIAKINKINGIEGKIYYSRLSYEGLWDKNWKIMLGMEVERNHRFEVDARAVTYVTHYLN